MKTLISCSAGLLLAATSLPSHAAVLTFDRAVACGVVACVQGNSIDQGYGDSAFVNISYSSRSAAGNGGAFIENAYFGGTGYGGLADVVYGGTSATEVLEIQIAALGGASVSFSSFDIGGYLADRSSFIRLYDLDYNLIVDYDTTASGTGSNGNAFIGFATTTGYILQIGADGYNVGLDNLEFGFEAAAGVPEPTSWSLMIVGFGLAGAALRRQSAVVARA